MPDPSVLLVPFSSSLIGSYNRAVGTVARERKYLASVEPFTLESTASFVEQVLKSGGVLVLAVTKKDEVVGWCDVIPKPYEGMRHVAVLGMGVVEEYRGRGIGRKLLERVISEAAERGVRKIELEVFASNDAAVRLYESAGFVHEGVRRAARILDGTQDDIVLMARHLGAG